MAKTRRAQTNADADGKAEGEGSSSFAWEFAKDETTRPSTPLSASGRAGSDRDAAKNKAQNPRPQPQIIEHDHTAVGRQSASGVLHSAGRFGTARANYVRDQLDRALDAWWASAELPPLALLRDGLLLLEAGGSVSESQRSLLLRSALAYDRGIQTALRHQTDAERVALILAEAVVEWESPVDAERLPAILKGNERIQLLLVKELERTRVLMTGEPRRRSQQALDMLPPSPRQEARYTVIPTASLAAGRRPVRQILLFLLLVTFVGLALWRQRQVLPEGMVTMPAASYALLVSAHTGTAESVELAAFFIDRFEVTNRDYRSCIEQGACLWPVRTQSLMRDEYFTNPIFDDYPVINITQRMASAFCEWQGKRLPTADEWQAAASVSPTTGMPFRYPWGEAFETQRANGAGTANGDTVAVGSFRPGGKSPSGAEDMAGNVAEWTSTVVEGLEGKTYALVKGGSFLSHAAEMFVGANTEMDVNEASVQVGFRCAQSRFLPVANP